MFRHENNVKKMKKNFYSALIVLFLGTSMSLSSFSLSGVSDLNELTSSGADFCVKRANSECLMHSTGNVYFGYGAPLEEVEQ